MDIAALNRLLHTLDAGTGEEQGVKAELQEAVRELVKENESLRQERDKYRTYLQEANDIIMRFDLQGNLLYINQDWKVNLDPASKDVLIPDFIDSFVHPDDAPVLKRLHQMLIDEKKKLSNVEHRVLHRDGVWHWMLTSLTPILDAKGEVNSILAISRSNHLQKMSEQKIMEQNYRLNLILDNMQEGVLQVDNKDRVLYANPSMCKLYGYSQDEMIGKIGYELFALPENKQQIIDENLQRLEGISNEYIIRGRKKDGSRLWIRVSGTPLKDEKGEVIGSVGIMTDFTERQEILESLMISEERSRSLFENAHNGVFQFSLDGSYFNVNKSFAQIFGYDSVEEIVITRLGAAEYSVNQKEHEKIIEKLMLEGSVANEEIQMRRKDGRFIWLMVFAKLREDRDGRMLIEGSCVDITDIKALREQVIISQRSEAIAKLTAGIAHDFNNFLTIILAYTEDMLDHISPESILHSPASEILKAGSRAANLTRQLMAFSSKQILSSEEIAINSLINNLASITSRIIEPNVQVKYQLSENLPLVKIDAGQLEQVLLNVITNAKEAMPQGGELLISSFLSSVEAGADSEYKMLKSGIYVNLSISDTGVGMDKDTLAQVFEPFFTTKKEVSGVGLGLSAALGVIRQAGGDIICDSEAGSGSTFRIMLPALAAPKHAQSPATQYNGKNAKGHKLLIVEDDEALGKMMQKMLSNLGYRVELCLSSEDALQHFAAPEHQDLIIIDLKLPGMDGWTLANKIRELKSAQKILMMAGMGWELLQKTSFRNSNIPFVQKPFSIRTLQPIIAELLADAPKPRHYLLIDPDDALCKHFAACSLRAGHFAHKAGSFTEANKAILNKDLDCIIINLDAPEIRGSQLAQKLLDLSSKALRFAYTAHPDKWPPETLKILGIDRVFGMELDWISVLGFR